MRSSDRACPITPRWSAGPSQAPAVTVGVSQYPRIAPRLVGLQRIWKLFVPAGIAFQDGRAGVLAPMVEVSGGSQADALLGGGIGRADTRIEHEPRAVPAAHHRAGPSCDVIECRAVGRRDRV